MRQWHKIFFGILLTGLILFTYTSLSAASPRQITYKDYLKDPNTSLPYNGSNYKVEFRLYNASTGGTLEFCEVQQNVTIDNGNIFVSIGKATTNGIPDNVFLPPSEDYIEVAVGTSLGSSGGSDPYSHSCLYSGLTNQLSRIELDAAAYVYHAKKADDADTCTLCGEADTLDGYNSTDFVLSTYPGLVPSSCTLNGQIAEWYGGAWVCGTDDVGGGGSGDITAVYTDSSMSGGAASGDVSLSIATGGVTSSHIADGTIGSADIADGSIAAADLGINVTGSVEGVSPNTKGGNIDLVPSPEISITGTDATDTISLSIATGGITSAHIANGAVGSAAVADNSLTAADLSVNVVSSVDGVTNDGGNIDLVGGSGIAITPDDTNNQITISYTGTAISGVDVKDEGTAQGTVTSLNFTGAGVTAAVAGSEATINIPGGGGTGDITAVNTPVNSGLTGGATSGDVTLSLASTYQLPQTCSNTQLPQWNSTSSTWTCVSSSSVADTRCDALGTCSAVYGGPNLTGMITSSIGITGTTSTGVAGVYGYINDSISPDRYGILGVNKGLGYGIIGMTDSTHTGVAAIRGNNFGEGAGIYGETFSTNPGSAALVGHNEGQGHGLLGYTKSTLSTAAAIHANNQGPGYGIWIQSVSGTGLRVEAGNGIAIDAVGDIRTTGHLYVHDGAHYGDVAEPVLTAPNVEPGDIVIISSSDGTVDTLMFTKSMTPYDTRVAGIISTNPSMILANDKGRLPLAVSGIVPVKVDASYGEINPGDLLTSSPTSGYAMKVSDHAKAQGAIIGKALESLKDGGGKIMVLVTLQ